MNNESLIRFKDLVIADRNKLVKAGRLNCDYYDDLTHRWHACTNAGRHNEDAIYRVRPTDTQAPAKPPVVQTYTEQVIFSGPATIVIWPDQTKTFVKLTEKDKFDPVKGYLLNYFMKQSGRSRTSAHKFLAKIAEQYALSQPVKKTKTRSK